MNKDNKNMEVNNTDKKLNISDDSDSELFTLELSKEEVMTLFEQWQYARDNFQHYSIRYIYDTGDGFRRTVSSEEKQYCFDMANKWDGIIKELRLKIIAQSNVY